MELGELIDHFRTVYLDDVSNQVDGQPDELFGHESIVRLFQAGQDEFARKTWCIVDDEQAAICTINLDLDATNNNANYTGEQLVPYSPKIIKVIRARFSDSDVPIALTGFGYSELRWFPTAGNLRPFDVNVVSSLTSGRPASIFFDSDSVRMKFDRPLDASTSALDLIMRVVRKPITALTSDDLEASPEIPEDYHLALCEFVGKELLKGPNIDADGRQLRANYAQNWQARIVEGKREMRRRMQGPIGWRFGAWAA